MSRLDVLMKMGDLLLSTAKLLTFKMEFSFSLTIYGFYFSSLKLSSVLSLRSGILDSDSRWREWGEGSS